MSSQPFHRRCGALVALWALGAALVLPIFGLAHQPDADVECLAIEAAVHHATTQFERVIPPPTGDHCPACHLLRALSGADATARQAGPAPTRVRFAPPNSAPLSTTDRSRVSTRGPPALAPADVRLRPVLAS